MNNLTPAHPAHPNNKSLSTHTDRKSLPKQVCTLCTSKEQEFFSYCECGGPRAQCIICLEDSDGF